MFKLVPTKTFKKSIKRLANDEAALGRLRHALDLLINNAQLPTSFRPHVLRGKKNHYNECHIQPDLLLVYFVDWVGKTIYLQDIGSHNHIFGK
jgi:mRNA interferase YafQ